MQLNCRFARHPENRGNPEKNFKVKKLHHEKCSRKDGKRQGGSFSHQKGRLDQLLQTDKGYRFLVDYPLVGILTSLKTETFCIHPSSWRRTFQRNFAKHSGQI